MSESESDALPLGDTPIDELLYYIMKSVVFSTGGDYFLSCHFGVSSSLISKVRSQGKETWNLIPVSQNSLVPSGAENL